jgi:hypothetical protein
MASIVGMEIHANAHPDDAAHGWLSDRTTTEGRGRVWTAPCTTHTSPITSGAKWCAAQVDLPQAARSGLYTKSSRPLHDLWADPLKVMRKDMLGTADDGVLF